MSDTEKSEAGARGALSLREPLRIPIFRNLLAADLVSDIGTFMQSVGAAWLMVSLGAGPIYVALTQTASSLPFFLLALPAGSAGDIFDRRKLVLATESWMLVVALLLAGLTIAGLMTPWLLLVLTFALSVGDALETPTWRAILPELVRKEDLEAASALNGIEFNLARAVGPALAGVVIAAAGVSASFVINCFSFVGVIAVIVRWKRPVRKQTAPPETLKGATVAALRYVGHSPAIIRVVARTGVVLFFSSALFALLPSVARTVSRSATGYGLLLGCFGVGAIGGAMVMQWARAKWSTEATVSGGVAVMGLTLIATGGLHRLVALAPLMLISGASWVVFVSLINALVQNLAPDWVRARVLAIFILVYQGSFALGSLAWGAVAQRHGIQVALVWAGVGTIATTVFALFARLPDSTADLSPWNQWRMPVLVKDEGAPEGPVLVTVEYVVLPEREAEFVKTIHRYGHSRRRSGASRWEVFRDVEKTDHYLEVFLLETWAEHLRQHERQTRADHELERRLRSCVATEPEVRHMIYSHLKD